MIFLETITNLLLASPLLLLFAVLGLGHALGSIRLGSFRLGVAGILFAGIGVSAIQPDLQLPEMIYELGLVLFVYTIGLASGPGFFASFKQNGLRDNLLGACTISVAAGITACLARLLHLSAPLAVGLFAGSLTNTPALAGAVEALRANLAGADSAAADALLSAPIIGYSLTYPVGVIGIILVIHVFSRLWRDDHAQAAPGNDRDQAADAAPERADAVTWCAVVSHRQLTGRTVASLGLAEQDTTVTHIRRGDTWQAATPQSTLLVGDEVRVVAPSRHIQAVRNRVGDSLRELAEVDLPSTAIGIALGLLLGLIPVPLPGGIRFRLGFAGGPLLVALFLGWRGRTGPLVWQMPYTVNHTLRHLGIALFLAGIGTQAGYAFASTLAEYGFTAVATGTVVTLTYATLTMVIGRRVFRIPMAQMAGLLSGLQTQPAALAYVNEKTASNLPNIGYATVYPMAMVVKIILAQVMLNLLSRV